MVGKARSDLEENYAWQIRYVLRARAPEREWRFTRQRRWRFDFAWPDLRIAVEIEGVRADGKARHQTISGFIKDCDKYNAAALLGWRIFRFTQAQIKSGEALATTAQALGLEAIAYDDH